MGRFFDAGADIPRAQAWINTRLHSLAQRWLGRPAKHTPRIVFAIADGLHRFVNGIAGVVAYFVTAPKRDAVRARLSETLAELTRQKHEIVLVKVSALVAFDVLRQGADRYKIAAWFTLGCPLRTLVRTGQRGADLGAINESTVKQWFNLYAPRDLVAAPIASVFPAYPICDERIEGAHGRLASHHYWANPRVDALIPRAVRD